MSERRGVTCSAGNAAGVTALFFGLVLLAATQDVAVDGWALTLLSARSHLAHVLVLFCWVWPAPGFPHEHGVLSMTLPAQRAG
jgi:hypothetical protein